MVTEQLGVIGRPDLTPTEAMVEAGCRVNWVRAYQREFARADGIMRALVHELWTAMETERAARVGATTSHT